jgi:hypothetical protein
VPLIIIFIVLSDQGCAEIDVVIRNAIMTAYMNAYADALEIRLAKMAGKSYIKILIFLKPYFSKAR